MMFIKLNSSSSSSSEVFFVNFDNVETFVKNNNGSVIFFVDSGSDNIEVKETPEEIMKLIEEASK